MNKYIAEYISKQKKQNHEDKKMPIADVINKLQIGEREYISSFDGVPTMEFPYYDSVRDDYYRYTVGDVTDEEFEELLKYVPNDDKPKEIFKNKMSFWYWFAIVLMLGGIIGGIALASERETEGAGIGLIIGSMLMCSQIILLSKIEYNTRKNN